jgi:hypothetical protein
MDTKMKEGRERIAQLETEIAELKARMPKHSVPPAMIIELEDLEDELAQLESVSGADGHDRR